MAGMPLYLAGGGADGGKIRLSFFLKLNQLLTHQTALVDIDGGGVGFARVSWDPTEYLMAELAIQGGSGFIPLWPPSTSPPVNQWLWISVLLGANTDPNFCTIYGQVWSSTTTPGPQTGVFHSGLGGLVSCGLGWGVPLSSTYNPFPNALGDEMTELCIETELGPVNDLAVRTPPLAPITVPSGSSTPTMVALYHCDGPLGANQVIKDATANHYDLSPGSANGDLIVHDSPF